MIKAIVKLTIWGVIGLGSTFALLDNSHLNLNTPWKYTIHSTIPVGTEITLTQPNGEPVTMSIAEGQAISGSKTFDVGAPVTLLGVFLLGSILAYGLKARRCTGPCTGP